MRIHFEINVIVACRHTQYHRLLTVTTRECSVLVRSVWYAGTVHLRNLHVINTNRHPITYRFGVIAAYCSNFGHSAFLSHPLGSLGTTYDVYCRLVGKRVVDLLLVLIELFHYVLSAEALRAKIDRKSAICKRVCYHPPNSRIEGDVPTNHFCTDS